MYVLTDRATDRLAEAQPSLSSRRFDPYTLVTVGANGALPRLPLSSILDDVNCRQEKPTSGAGLSHLPR